MSLFSDLNKANKIMMGLNECKEEPIKEEVPAEEPKQEEVKEEVQEVQEDNEPIEEGKKDECNKAKKDENEEEEENEGKKAKKDENEDELDEGGKNCKAKKECKQAGDVEYGEPEEVDEAIQTLLEEGYSLVESNTIFYVCEDCGAMCECGGLCEDCGGELEEAVKLVVKNGKVVKKQIKKKKKKMSAKQKQALKKAQKKAQTGSAKKARAKSMKVRNKRGLDEGFEEFECPKCGYIGDMEEVEAGIFVCPECDVELEIDGLEANESANEALEVYKRALDIPEFILNEGDDLVKKYLKNVFEIDLDEE